MTTTKDHWVVCADYAAGPFTRAGADGLIASLGRATDPRLCHNLHAIVRQAAQPAVGLAARRYTHCDHVWVLVPAEPGDSPAEPGPDAVYNCTRCGFPAYGDEIPEQPTPTENRP